MYRVFTDGANKNTEQSSVIPIATNTKASILHTDVVFNKTSPSPHFKLKHCFHLLMYSLMLGETGPFYL